MAKLALCIGINDYPGTENDLTGCVNDAHDWAAELGKRGFTVNLLLDAAATKVAMVTAMVQTIASARSGDLVVFTYSGHGTWVPDLSGDEPDGRDEALCPWDIAQEQALLDDEIEAIFTKRASGVRILLISDSCHSGSVTRGDDSDLDPGLPRARFLPPQVWMPADQLGNVAQRPKHLLGGLARSGGDLLLAGCTDGQFSWDTRFRDRPNGAFTFYALKTLSRLSATASYQDWMKAISPSYLPTNQLPQDPQLFGSRTARHWQVFA
ncbi:caspase family protein [Pseudomonas akapageensis]|uniref:caspase family protein n=1 Tax=Pseudomonas akapageensis TaxID=2609961 RepID=UPI00140E6CCC|nr:caspase family protein [Pseudomonas akapageensis]